MVGRHRAAPLALYLIPYKRQVTRPRWTELFGQFFDSLGAALFAFHSWNGSFRFDLREHPPMKPIAAFLVILALFILFVGSRFKPSDGEALSSISRLTVGKVRNALPPAERIAAPVNALRCELPDSLDLRVKARLSTEKSLEGMDFAVVSEGTEVKLRGIVPDSASRRRAVELAQNTLGVGSVVDELAVPVP